MHEARHRRWRRLGLTGLLATALSALLLLASASTAATVGSSLYDQNSSDSGSGFQSTILGNVALADDFVVPAATSWQIGSVQTTGLDQGLTSVRVTIYSDSANSPGTQVYTRTLSAGSFTEEPAPYPNWSGGNLTIPVNVTLGSGHYWLSVQGDLALRHGSQPYLWESRDAVANQAAMCLDPVRGFSTWTDLATCSGYPNQPPGSLDLMFALYAPGPPDNLTPVNGADLTATEGAPLSTGTLGTFTDSNTTAIASDFTATVDWGDGSPTSTGTVTASNGGFTVTGSHTYTEHGDYTALTTVNGDGGTAQINTTVHVGDAQLTIGQVRVALKPSRLSMHSTATLTVKFTDANPYATASDFVKASVDWGDTTPLTPLTNFAKAGASWSASATHDCVRGSTYTITITINDIGGATVSTTKTITVR